MSDSSSYAVGASYWCLVLADRRRAQATVVVTLRSGVQLGPGQVSEIPKGGVPGSLSKIHYDKQRNPETRWTFDVTEVVAVEATSA